MLILAIDTALEACSAGVLDSQTGATAGMESQPMKRGHAEALMPLIGRVMKQAGVTFLELDRIAVTTGPGSFTGLRVGLSAARGIALAADKPVIGVTTLTAFAAPFVSETGRHPIICAIDARHGNIYLQVSSGNGATLMRPRLAPIDDVMNATRFGAPCMVGNAAQLIAERWPTEAETPILVHPQPAPDITWVAWVGAAVRPESAPARPYYLRAPDAKPAPGLSSRASSSP